MSRVCVPARFPRRPPMIIRLGEEYVGVGRSGVFNAGRDNTVGSHNGETRPPSGRPRPRPRPHRHPGIRRLGAEFGANSAPTLDSARPTRKMPQTTVLSDR